MSDENIIFWSSGYKLKLSDFKKECDESNNQASSYIGYGIHIDIDYNEDRTKYFIKEIDLISMFFRDKSFFNHFRWMFHWKK